MEDCIIPPMFFPDPSNTPRYVVSNTDSSTPVYIPTPSHILQSRQLEAKQKCQSSFHLVMVNGSNFSKHNYCGYRVKLQPVENYYITEQSVKTIKTNINISEMHLFSMHFQTNSEDGFDSEFKLITQGFLNPSYSGPLFIRIKNIGSYTKCLFPCDILGYLVIHPFIADTEVSSPTPDEVVCQY